MLFMLFRLFIPPIEFELPMPLAGCVRITGAAFAMEPVEVEGIGARVSSPKKSVLEVANGTLAAEVDEVSHPNRSALVSSSSGEAPPLELGAMDAASAGVELPLVVGNSSPKSSLKFSSPSDTAATGFASGFMEILLLLFDDAPFAVVVLEMGALADEDDDDDLTGGAGKEDDELGTGDDVRVAFKNIDPSNEETGALRSTVSSQTT